MDNLDYLFMAFAIVWVAIFCYIFVLSRRQKRVQRGIDSIRKSIHSSP